MDFDHLVISVCYPMLFYMSGRLVETLFDIMYVSQGTFYLFPLGTCMVMKTGTSTMRARI